MAMTDTPAMSLPTSKGYTRRATHDKSIASRHAHSGVSLSCLLMPAQRCWNVRQRGIHIELMELKLTRDLYAPFAHFDPAAMVDAPILFAALEDIFDARRGPMGVHG
jgi:hypothetical protein